MNYTKKATFLAIALAIAFALSWAVSKTYKKHILPNGTVVHCATLYEAEHGSYLLTDCEDGATYYVRTHSQDKPGDFN